MSVLISPFKTICVIIIIYSITVILFLMRKNCYGTLWTKSQLVFAPSKSHNSICSNGKILKRMIYFSTLFPIIPIRRNNFLSCSIRLLRKFWVFYSPFDMECGMQFHAFSIHFITSLLRFFFCDTHKKRLRAKLYI